LCVRELFPRFPIAFIEKAAGQTIDVRHNAVRNRGIDNRYKVYNMWFYIGNRRLIDILCWAVSKTVYVLRDDILTVLFDFNQTLNV